MEVNKNDRDVHLVNEEEKAKSSNNKGAKLNPVEDYEDEETTFNKHNEEEKTKFIIINEEETKYMKYEEEKIIFHENQNEEVAFLERDNVIINLCELFYK